MSTPELPEEKRQTLYEWIMDDDFYSPEAMAETDDIRSGVAASRLTSEERPANG